MEQSRYHVNHTSLPVDEQTLLEEIGGIPVTSINRINQIVTKNCWSSLLSDPTMRRAYAEQVQSLFGYSIAPASQVDNVYLIDDTSQQNQVLYDCLNTAVTSFASKLKLPIFYDTRNVANHDGVLFFTMSSAKWSEANVPQRIAQEMLGEIEHCLRQSAVSAVYFDNFDKAPPLLRSFAMTLLEYSSVAVYINTSIPLQHYLSKPPSTEGIDEIQRDAQLLNSGRIYPLLVAA